MEVRIAMGKSLENVKVGDVVIEHCRWENVIATVTKVTATQIVIGRGDRYRKKDGYMVGGSGGWYYRWITIPEEGEVEQLKRQKFIENVVSRLDKLTARDVTYEQAVKIKEVLGL